MSMCHYLVSVSIFGFNYYVACLHIIPLELLRNFKTTKRKIHCNTNKFESYFMQHVKLSPILQHQNA